MLNDLYLLEEGDYSFKDGILNDKYYFDGNGTIIVDKYGNIKFNINTQNGCISKTSLGSVKYSNSKCDSFKIIDSKIIKNNSSISFELSENDLEYKISKKDDFKGTWIKENYDKNLVLDYYKEGDNYIWFKDSKGNISNSFKFNVNCLNAEKANYKSDVFYCTGSTLMIDNIEWIVIEDNNSSIKLMKRIPIENKISMCLDKNNNDYCFYSKKEKNTYKWSNSYINYYLNNEYIKKLSTDIYEKLNDFYICDDYNSFKCNNESCGGRTQDEFIYNGWYCNHFTKSKVKVISYDEYNLLYYKIGNDNKKIIDGNYWAINSYKLDYGSSVQYNYDFYILEDLTKKLDIRPIIQITK